MWDRFTLRTPAAKEYELVTVLSPQPTMTVWVSSTPGSVNVRLNPTGLPAGTRAMAELALVNDVIAGATLSTVTCAVPTAARVVTSSVTVALAVKAPDGCPGGLSR